mmetsp:Transcript_27310/g.57460  ORF Transcript_27310/g.57460 Transcript_27310/m.57460 type:complete len:483 (+) Transcript_27310:80-1528(+)
MRFAALITKLLTPFTNSTSQNLHLSPKLSTLSKRHSLSAMSQSNDAHNESNGVVGPPKVQESVIRKMTRLASQYNAVNLSQGFPNESPPLKVRLALAHAVLSGRTSEFDEENYLIESMMDLLRDVLKSEGSSEALTDELNQYSPPMGRPDARKAVSDYYHRLYGYDVEEDQITLTLGATEAVAAALRTVGRPGDKVVIFEPFHELYPSQCQIFHLDPVFVTLKPNYDYGTWNYDEEELKNSIIGARALILNTPHNPTGKIFQHGDLKKIVDICIENDVYIITDEIYEWMCYPDEYGNSRRHTLIPKEFPEAKDLTLVCNSLGKSASATGWRLGWCLHPPHLTDSYRGIHDQLVAMSPHPMQYASITYLNLPDEYFKEQLAIRYKERLRILALALKEAGFKVVSPEGSYYLFVDYHEVEQLNGLSPMDAAMKLMRDIGVACVPGDNFYGKSLDGQHMLRFAACRSMSDISIALERLKKLNPLK